MADEAMNTEMQDASASGETQQEVETDTAVQSQGGATDNGGDNSATNDTSENANTENAGEVSEETPFLVARYNKEDVSLSEQQAKDWVERGMHYHNKLDYLAVIQGTTVSELIKNQIEAIDKAKRLELEERYGDDDETIDLYMQKFHEEQKGRYEKAIADRKIQSEEAEKTKVQQLGEQFIELQKQFPNIKSFAELPEAVKRDAQNMSLEHAYLKHLLSEQRKINSAKENQSKAEEKTTGSMSSDNNSSDTVRDDFIKGIWGR